MTRPVYAVRAALWQLPRQSTPDQIRAAVEAALDTKGQPTMTNQPTDAERLAAECDRVPPFGESCTLGRNHSDPCDWYTASAADRAGARDRAQAAYSAVAADIAASPDLLPPTDPRGQHRMGESATDEHRPVYCPFDADGDCPADCPSLAERSCINGE